MGAAPCVRNQNLAQTEVDVVFSLSVGTKEYHVLVLSLNAR